MSHSHLYLDAKPQVKQRVKPSQNIPSQEQAREEQLGNDPGSIFRRLDADPDGCITVSEAKRVPNPLSSLLRLVS